MSRSQLEFLTSFELLNASVKSPVNLEKPAPLRYPAARAFSMRSYKNEAELFELIEKDNRARKTARALVLVEAAGAEEAIHKSSGFIHTVTDLQGLAQRNSVAFWGAAAYQRHDGSWKAERKSWNVVRTEPSQSFFGHGVATTELQGHLRKWLEVIDSPDFPLDDFANSVHLLSDSYRPEQFLELMFLEAWVAFELLTNQFAQSTGAQLSMPKDLFKDLKGGLKKYLKENFRDKLGGESYRYVVEQLSSLERVPVGHLIERLASQHGLNTEQYNILGLKRIRNGLMHYGKEPSEFPLDFGSLSKMRQLLEDTLLAMIKTKEVNRLERSLRMPKGDLDIALDEENLNEYSMSFDAEIRNGKGTFLTQGKFDARWTSEKVEVSGKVEDPWALNDVLNDDSDYCSIRGRSGEAEVTVGRARPTRLRHPQTELVALDITLDYKG